MGPAQKKQKVSKGLSKVVDKKPEPVQKKESESDNSSSEDEEKLEDLDDLEIDDELEVADASSGESSEEDEDSEQDDEEEDSDNEEIPKLKKKKNLDDGSESFAGAFNAIIGSKLKAYDRKDPILARNKVTIKKLESDKLEAKAKRALSAEKKALQDKHRVINLLPSSSEPEKVREIIDGERKLKKVAQKGVVRLFNAILSTQVRTNHELDQEKVGQAKKEELMNEISKEKFLDLVQAAGQS